MLLTDHEKRMLHGEMGYPLQKAMQILVALGNSFDAKKMLQVNNVHMPGSSIVVAGVAGTRFVEEIQAKGGNFCAHTTTNPTAVDSCKWRKLGIGEEQWQLQRRLTDAYEKMGAVTCSTCTPYYLGNIPRLEEHVAWGESSAVAFANSVLGARTNRERGPSALAVALTGRVPAYGFHLKENRYGKFLVKVTTPIKGITDYGTLGYFVGEIAGQDTPVLTGIPASVTLDELKQLGAALAFSGAVSLFHAIGVTPEVHTIAAAFRRHQPEFTVEFGLKQKIETEALLNKEKTNYVDWITFGCPHASIQEFREIAKALAGKNIVAYQDPPPKTGKCGRPPVYGQKLKLMDLFHLRAEDFQQAPITTYGERKTISFLCLDLIWRPIKAKVRFVLVVDGENRFILMGSDLGLAPLDIIQAYGYRFKIEVTFKMMKHLVGAFYYHFWTVAWPKIGKRTASDLATITSEISQRLIALATNAIEGFVHLGCIATGILQILALNNDRVIWKKYRGWLRTYSSEVPSEETVRSVILEDFYHHFHDFRNLAIHEIIMSKSREALANKDGNAA